MQGKIQKSLVLKRCYVPDGSNISLEKVVEQIKGALPNHKERVFGDDLLKSYIIAYMQPDTQRGKGVYVGIYRQDIGATGLIDYSSSSEDAGVEEFKVPENRAWLDTEIVLYIVDNHILACNLSGKDKLLSKIFLEIAKRADIIRDDFVIDITDVPNTPELGRINKVGVKNIELNLTSYLSSIEEFALKSQSSSVAQFFEKLLGAPSSLEDVQKRAATKGKLLLSRGKFSKEEINKDEWLTSIGGKIVDENLDDYTLTLEDGSKVSTKSLKVSKLVQLNKHANSFSREYAHLTLSAYYDELLDNGSLNW